MSEFFFSIFSLTLSNHIYLSILFSSLSILHLSLSNTYIYFNAIVFHYLIKLKSRFQSYISINIKIIVLILFIKSDNLLLINRLFFFLNYVILNNNRVCYSA